MKIETEDFISLAEARDILGASPRGFYRAIRRAGLEDVSIEVWGMRVVKKAMLPLIEENYFPTGSARRSEAAKGWGCAGGTEKARRAKRKSST